MTVMFVGTLRASYYEKLIGSAMKNFINMVILGEIIENTVKSGRISIRETFGSIKKIVSKGKEKGDRS